jgi:hypothetical protein
MGDSYHNTFDPEHTINFGAEINAYSTLAAPNDVSLVAQYYDRTLTKLLDKNVRKYTFKAVMSLGLMQSINLNDTLKINGNYFDIDELDYNMLTLEASFKLTNTFREATALPPPADTEPPTIGVLSVVQNIGTTPPAIPLLSIGQFGYNFIEIEWGTLTGSNPLATVEIWRNGVKVQNVSPAADNYLDLGLNSDTNYAYYIVVIDDQGLNSQSNTVNQTTLQNYKPVDMSLTGLPDSVIVCDDLSLMPRYFVGAGSNPVNGDTIYSNNTGTIFDGQGEFYKDFNTNVSFNVSNIGVVSNLQPC